MVVVSKLIYPHTAVMGILNITPDSFSDGGSYNRIDLAIQRAKQMIAEGADVIDIGGESTRPGAMLVGVEEELNRVIPIIEALAKEIDKPISIDTYKAEVAKTAVHAGASIINDVYGGLKDPMIRYVAAQTGATYIITHNRLEPKQNCTMDAVCKELGVLTELALQAGVVEEKIWHDPGLGFAKTYEDNLAIMNQMEQLVQSGYPVVLGASRKTFIRQTLNRNANEVLAGSLATAVLGAQKGCAMIRVHDVAETKQALVMTDAIRQARTGGRFDG
jgi:dihydropteroate synthase